MLPDLEQLAERQYGAVATWQALQCGLTHDALRHAVRAGTFEKVTPSVLRLRGSDRSVGQRVMVAVLDAGPGSVLSHHSAAAWWRVVGYDIADLHVTRLRDGTTRRGRLAKLHYPTLLPPHHVTIYEGIPITTPARLMFDLAGHVHPKKMELTLERCWSDGLFTGKSLYRVKADLKGRGRRGNALMNELLVERPPNYRPAASGLELRVQEILKRNGFHHFTRQTDLGDEDEWIGRVDFYDHRRKVVLEVQSDRFHGALIDREADARRRQRLIAAGFTFVEVTDFHAFHQPWVIIDRLNAALGRR